MLIHSIIRALLEENTVSINGLGTFCVKKLPAQMKDDIVYPPQNIIEFEYAKEVAGFDFITKLSKWEQIRMDKALDEISKWIALLEEGLEHNKSIFYDNLGTFLKEDTGRIVFQSVINPQLNIENEGLEPVIVPIKSEEEPIQKTEIPIKDKRLLLVEKTKKRDKFWFLFTILLAMLTLGILFFKTTIYEYYQTILLKITETAVVNDKEIEEVVYNNETTETETDAKFISEEFSKEVVITEMDEKKNVLLEKNEIYVPYQVGKYYVIAGSFLQEEDALRHIKQKKLEKYQAKLIVQPHNSRVRVCIGVFDNERDAEIFIHQIDKNYWVLK